MKRTAVVAACAVGAVGILAFGLADDVTPGSGGISTIVSLSSFGLSPVRPPKVFLVPQEGQTATKTVKTKVLSFSDTRIDCQVIKGLAGAYDVQVVPRDAGVAPVTMLDSFTITVPAPASVEPASGPVKIPVTIHGSGFGESKGSVTIGGRKAKVTTWGADAISVVVPRKLLAGEQPVVVTNRAGASTAAVSFTVEGTTTGGGAARIFAYDIGATHFETTVEEDFYFGGAYNVSQGFLGVGASVKPNGVPSLAFNVNGPQLATPMPYTVTTSGGATGLLTCTYSDGSSVWQAFPGSNFVVTVTGYADGVLEGTFSGDLTKVVGSGAATVTVTNGRFKSFLVITGQ